MSRPVAVSMFSGAGGFDLGIESSGFDIAVSVDIDPIHCAVHHYNFPYTATICKDVQKIDFEEIQKKLNHRKVDLLLISAPCQAFSLAGKRDYFDPRSELIFETIALLKNLEPKYFIFENVPGLVQGRCKDIFDLLVARIEETEYKIVKPVRILVSSSYSVPQKRKRLIMVGARQDLPLPEYPEEGKEQVTVKDAIGNLARIPAYIGEDEGLEPSIIEDYPGWTDAWGHNRHKGLVYGHLGSLHSDKTKDRFAALKPGEKDSISRFLKLHPKGFSNTLRAGTPSSKGSFTAPRPIHYKRDRCITVREAARLHSYPDWFQFHKTIHHGFRQIGNSVPPILAYYLGMEIIKCLGIDREQLEILKFSESPDCLRTFTANEAADFWGVPHDTIAKRKKSTPAVRYSQLTLPM